MDSTPRRRNAAVLLAGGLGARAGLGVPKQFFKLRGKTVLEYALEAFQNVPEIDEIAIVAAPEYHKEIQNLCGWAGKLTKILEGGASRCHSTLNALKAYEGQENLNLLIHDAARPLVGGALIQSCIEALGHHGAVTAALACTDTLIRAEGGFIKNFPPRSAHWRCQTPQGFHRELLQAAYDRAGSHLESTDDCGVVFRFCPETPIFVVQGEERNLKLTHRDDIFLLESFLRHPPS